MNGPATQPSASAGLLGAARRRPLLVVLCAVLVPAVALVLSLAQEPVYEATATVEFRESELDDLLVGDDIFRITDDEETLTDTNVGLAGVASVHEGTARRFGGSLRAREISETVTVDQVGTSRLLDVTARESTAAGAQRLADIYASELVAYRRERDRAAVSEARAEVERELDRRSPTGAAPQPAPELSEKRRDLLRLERLVTGDVELVDEAERPAAATSPKPLRSVLLGLLFGPLLGLLLAWVVDRVDRRIKDADDAGMATGQPLIAEVPASQGLASAPPATPLEAEDADPFRKLRTSLRHHRGGDIPSVVIASPSAGDGRTTLAWNLAAVAAHSGSTVLLLEADPRRPALADRLQLEAPFGLSDVLRGDVELREVVHTVASQGSGGDGRSDLSVDVVVAGSISEESPDLFDSDRMRELLDQAERGYDLTVIDTPPTSIAPEGLALAAMARGVVEVCRLHKTPRRAAAKLREELARLDALTLGVVLNAAGEGGRRGQDPPPPSERQATTSPSAEVPVSR